MKKYYIISLFSILGLTIATIAQPRDFSWGSTFRPNIATEVRCYSLSQNETNEDLVAAGLYGGTVDFDPSSVTNNLTTITNKTNRKAAFIQKSDKDGNLVWAKSIKSHNDNSSLISIEVYQDQSNNIYATGSFWGTVDFDPADADTFELSTGSMFAEKAFFIVKLNEDGDFIWAKHIITDNAFSNIASDIVLSDSNDVYIVGNFLDSVDFDPGPGVAKFGSQGFDQDIFILKLDKNGDFVWVKTIASKGSDDANKIIIDNNRDLYIGGVFSDSADFDPGTGTSFQRTNPTNRQNSFVLKLDTGGNFIWVKTYEAYQQSDLIRDASGALYTTGQYTGQTDFDPSASTASLNVGNSTEAFILKLDTDGNYDWVRSTGRANSSTNNRCEGFTLATDTALNIYLGGRFTGRFDFDVNPTSSTVKDAGSNRDIFLLKLDSSGNFIWVDHLTPSSAQSGNRNIPEAIHVDSLNAIYLVGQYTGNSNLAPENRSRVNVNSRISGAGNGFILKWEQCITTFDTIAIYACGSSYTSQSGKTFVTAGTYNDTLINALKCDSIVTFNLTLNNASSDSVVISACDQYLSPKNQIYTNSGIYRDTLISSNGCDSIIITNLTILEKSTGNSITESACDQYISPSGKTFTVSGLYQDTIKRLNTCDSIISIDLTINIATSSNITEIACDSFISPSGNIYKTSGTYVDVIPNNNGCDSSITIDLTVNKSTIGAKITRFECDEYNSPSGKTFTSSGIYFDTLLNTENCNLIIEIDLTIGESEYISLNPTSCESYTSPSGRYVYTESGLYLDTIFGATASGCNEYYSINFTKESIDLRVIEFGDSLESYVNPNDADFQWLDCNNSFLPIPGATNEHFTSEDSGRFAVEITKGQCIDTTDCYSIFATGLGDQIHNLKFVVYPNPSTGDFFIQLNNRVSGTFIIRDLYGKIVLQEEVSSKLEHHLNLNASKGIYMLQLIDSKGKQGISKIIIK